MVYDNVMIPTGPPPLPRFISLSDMRYKNIVCTCLLINCRHKMMVVFRLGDPDIRPMSFGYRQAMYFPKMLPAEINSPEALTAPRNEAGIWLGILCGSSV